MNRKTSFYVNRNRTKATELKEKRAEILQVSKPMQNREIRVNFALPQSLSSPLL